MTRFLMLLTIFTVFGSAVVFVISPVQAGFEFLPPKTGMAPHQQRPQAVAPPPQNIVPPAVAPMLPPPNAFPAAPVVMAPVSAPPMMAPPPVPNLSNNSMPMPLAVIPNVPTRKSGGLYIDPYPLNSGGNVASSLSNQSVGQGMAENGGGLTPVQLGAGMTSGARAQAPMQVDSRPVLNAPPTQLNAGITPIPGGEPPPLPNIGIEQAYRDTSVQSQDIAPQYANAVGFGKELPLELALSQVIPSGFNYELGQNIDQGRMVSWDGGEPWNIVLNNMLRPLNMTAVIQGNEVMIQPLARS